MTARNGRLLPVIVATSMAGLIAGGLAANSPATAQPLPGATAPQALTTSSLTTASSVTLADGLTVENSFVSAVGWVKPGDTYPSRIILTNPTSTPVADVSVTVAAPVGTDFVSASTPVGSHQVTADEVTWTVPAVAAATAEAPGQATLVLAHEADTLAEEPTLVWRDLSTTATVTVGTTSETARSHGPKVIPPGDAYDTARYGDRPFPVVPVAYTDRDYQATHSGGDLDAVINSADVEGSTFNLFQEMSLGQLFPHGTVPSADITQAGFDAADGYDFTHAQTGQTCGGVTFADTPTTEEGTALYPDRIRNGVYQLPGSTGYYGSDGNVSAIPGALVGVGTLMQIDNGCGPTGKLVHDAAVIADPEIDYSDYDTDKDGVVDFFMAVFAGCGGNGASQLSAPGDPAGACPYGDVSNDNVWPHSSSLEYYYTDAETGQPGYVTDDQLKDLEGRPLFYTSAQRNEMTTEPTEWKVFVRVGPYNVNPETAIDHASVISHEYGHSLGLPDFYSLGGRSTYGDWNLMATDKSQNMDVFSRQELGWVVPEVLEGGSGKRVDGWTDSKQDTHRIVWQRPDGTPYTLEGPEVHNSLAYVAKLPGRILLTEDRMADGEGASMSHTWWSGSGNDFGCVSDPSGGGHNIDLAIPELQTLPEGSTVDLSFKSMFDIEWDYDYGFVLTSTDGGNSFSSHPSTRSVPTTSTTNPNQNGCQATYSNGISGSSASYTDQATVLADRTLGEYPQSEWVTDSFDISDLAGASLPVLRFSYATDPGLARPGWFIDDVNVTATLPDGTTQELFVTDFESSGGPDDPAVFNGGCQSDTPDGATCTQGWTYVDAGQEAPSDHAYYLEMRDRSGFDLDGNGQVDRDPIAFLPGLSLVYTDEAHGYGNVGTDDPPAQSPLDSQPQPGESDPDLNDAAWTAAAGDSRFSDSGAGHVDNYENPQETVPAGDVANPWRFAFDCLTFDVLSMEGDDLGPDIADGNLTGDVQFTMGAGCAAFDYGYGNVPAPPANTAPTAAATATPTEATTKTEVTLDGTGSSDTETPEGLQYTWDFGDGGRTKDAVGATVSTTFRRPGTYTVKLTVTDPEGLTSTDTVTVTVTKAGR